MALGMPNRRAFVARPWMATLAAMTLQLGVFMALLLFVANSLVISSTASRLLGRDTGTANNYRSDITSSSSGGLASEEQFDVQRALSNLEEISRTPHSLNDPRSINVRGYLQKTIEQIIARTDAELSGPVNNSTVAEFKIGGSLMYWEDSSLVVRVPGTSDSRESLLVQAHYDAVPMSHGAYDDGVGVVVCLELLQSLVQHPVRHPVVINIDWGEENGLVGAILFARFHRWAEDVRAYINLEAGGVGGRAMVFRASHPALLSAYKQAAPSPHASLIGNSAFKLGIVKSDTDYSIYTTRYGIPGLDFAFTDHRSLYHTTHDSADKATAESILSMGVSTLGTARLIADSESILRSIPRSQRLPDRPKAAAAARSYQAADESFGDKREIITLRNMRHIVVSDVDSPPSNAVQDSVFYDILSRVMVVRSYSADITVNILTAVLGIAAVIGMQYPFARPLPQSSTRDHDAPTDWLLMSPSDRLILQLGCGGLFGSLFEGTVTLAAAWGAGLLASLVFVGVLVTVVMPRLAYTHVILFTLLVFSSSALAVTQVLVLWVARAHRMFDIRRITWYSLCLFRCVLLLAVVVPLESMEIGLLYREQLYAWAALAAAVLTALLDPNTALGEKWRHQIQSATAHFLEHRSNAESRLEERLLQDDTSDNDRQDNNDDALSNSEAASHPNLRISRKCNTTVAVVSNILSALRFILGVLVPLVIGMDIMLRQLIILKDHLVDGSPPVACIAIATLETVTFVMFMAPYIIGAMVDMDSSWPMRYASALAAAIAVRLSESLGWSALASGNVFSSSRSQISLHTNHDDGVAGYDEPESPSSSSGANATRHLLDNNDGGYQSDESEDDRVIDLGPSGNPSGRSEHGGPDYTSLDSDDGLGRQHYPTIARKGEVPEVVGRRMVVAWAGFWMFIWIVSQAAMLLGREYNAQANPLKVGVFQTTRVSFDCLQEGEPSGKCASTTLKLSSPDSNGLVRMLDIAAPENSSYFCFTQSVRDFYQCRVASKDGDSAIGMPDASSLDDATWSPESAINISSISHKHQVTDQGTLFMVTLNFSAPETRTCFIDFGGHRGFSQQAYSNPNPALPPVLQILSTNSSSPVIEHTVLPVMERAWFANGVSGEAAPIAEPISNRDAVFSGRIYAHKQAFDTGGLFSATIQYTVPIANAEKPNNVVADISCHFDLVDRHLPLLGSVINRSPDWAVFKPAGNVLSTVTVHGVRI
ncbi:hypothetical protein EV178_006400 [Coemansia sp. RSA 1646]|nr:hypothetical protein EV178_006400 [Coemansia sp. RSA 1646]